jgi:hypothetical protein
MFSFESVLCILSITQMMDSRTAKNSDLNWKKLKFALFYFINTFTLDIRLCFYVIAPLFSDNAFILRYHTFFWGCVCVLF